MPSLHAKMQPSAAKRWMNCPGSIALCENVVDPGGEFAEEGTACHEICEKVLNGGAWPVPGQKMSNGVEVSSEMLALCRVAVEWVLDYKDATGAVIHTEDKVEIGPVFGLPEDVYWGTSDIVGISPSERLILDFKFGYNPVSVEENPQALSYAFGAERKHGIAPVTRLVIMQPKCGEAPSEVVYTGAQMDTYREEFRPKILTASKGGPLVPGSWCSETYCRARAVCPALQDEMVALAQREWANPLVHSPEDLAEMLRKLSMIESAASALRAHAMKLIELGQEIPGWKIVRGDTKRAWLGEEKPTAEGLKKLGVDPFEKALVSPATAEAALIEIIVNPTKRKKLGVTLEKETKKAAKEAAKEILKKLAGKPEGRPVLVQESDPRPALPPVFTAADVAALDAASVTEID